MTTRRKILLGLYATLGLVAVFVGVIAVVLLTMDWDRFRGQIGSQASSRLGRTVEVRGHLQVVPAWRPQVRAEQFVIANAKGGSGPEMFRADDVYFQFRIWPLLIGRLEIDAVRLSKVNVLLEKYKDGSANWQFPTDSPEAAAVKAATPDHREEFPVLRHLIIQDAKLVYRSPGQKEPIEVLVNKIEARGGDMDSPVSLVMNGIYQKAPFSIDTKLGSFGVLRAGTEPYPVNAKINLDTIDATFDGTMKEHVKFMGLDGKISAKGENLADLYKLMGLPLPESPPYQLTGRLREEGNTYHLEGFKGVLGTSDMAGDVAVTTGGARPKIVAKVRSDALAMDDIAGFMGAKEPTAKGTANEQVKTQANTASAKPANDNKTSVIPDRPFRLDKLREMDAEVDYVAKSIKLSGVALDNMNAKLTLTDGKLNLHPLELGVFQGKVTLNLDLDASKDTPTVAGNYTVRDLSLGTAMKLLGIDDKSVGTLRGKGKLATRGGSLHQWASNADGSGILIMEGGQISNLLLELMALDLQEALQQWMEGDKEVAQISCLLAPYKLEQGRLLADPWLFDTSDALVVIRGYIDLKNETLEMRLTPQPKDYSFFNFRTSIVVEGDLKTRKAKVNMLDAIAKVVLKTLVAPAMPFVSPPEEEQARDQRPCDVLMKQAETAEAKKPGTITGGTIKKGTTTPAPEAPK
ncbi:MAG: AsmA family protein [Alphaproteobacteria bacterium]|nr:AsmA family protein [Alphaproteobacteria bacterium]